MNFLNGPISSLIIFLIKKIKIESSFITGVIRLNILTAGRKTCRVVALLSMLQTCFGVLPSSVVGQGDKQGETQTPTYKASDRPMGG